MKVAMTMTDATSQLEDYPRPTSLSFEKLKEEEEGTVLYVPSKGVTLQASDVYSIFKNSVFINLAGYTPTSQVVVVKLFVRIIAN